MTSSWFFLSTLNYDARSTTHQTCNIFLNRREVGWASQWDWTSGREISLPVCATNRIAIPPVDEPVPVLRLSINRLQTPQFELWRSRLATAGQNLKCQIVSGTKVSSFQFCSAEFRFREFTQPIDKCLSWNPKVHYLVHKSRFCALPCVTRTNSVLSDCITVIPRLTNDPANEFFG